MTFNKIITGLSLAFLAWIVYGAYFAPPGYDSDECASTRAYLGQESIAGMSPYETEGFRAVNILKAQECFTADQVEWARVRVEQPAFQP